MIENGASGYVLKNDSKEELMVAIETAYKGKEFLSFDAAAMIRHTDSKKDIVLTRREKEVLELIGEGNTNAQIAEKLFIGITTVIFHRKNILENLTSIILRVLCEGRMKKDIMTGKNISNEPPLYSNNQ